MRKSVISLAVVAGLLAFAVSAVAATVSQETALAAAEGFIRPDGFGARLLPDRSVASATAWGNLWIVVLEPSGHIILAGSDKCYPVISFSTDDFAEPEVGSPLAAKLAGDSLMVEKKEADESVEVNAKWEKLTAPVAKTRRLLAAKPTGTDGTGYTPFVAPLLGATWNQTAPFNDLSPYNYFCGCMATAAGQELRYWRWPYRYEKFRQTTHGVRDAQFNYSDFVLRPNGLVPFNWDKVVASAPNPASTPWAADKEATYNTAWLSLWAQSLTGMGYKPGGSGGTRQLAGTAEEYWYEKGRGMTYWNDGYTNLWNAIKADLDWGSPIQINTAAHQMVIDGYAVENYGQEDEVDWINLNLGYGNAVYWDNLKTAVTEGTYSGTLASFQTGFRPQKIVQFEPVPKVSGTSLELAWHLPSCYTNKISGFLLQTFKNGNIVGGGMVSSLGDTTERYTYKATGLEMGGEYTFTVTPIMSDASEACANSVTTTVGEPKAAPEFLSVSSVACGIELLQQDIFIECAYGITNKIDLTCSESTTEVVPYSSHLTILPDSQLSVTKNGNVFTVDVDATAMDPKWSGEMLVLTLVAKNEDGTEAYKNLMLRFNSMRQVINGTFEAAEGDGNSPVWFCGDTTIDAKGRTVSFGASAFQGTGKVTLIDSVGNGSFTFAGLDNFKGTLVFSGDVDVTLPSDMSKFEGALSITSGTYTLSNDLPASASVTIANGVTLNLDNANVASTITGAGTISITSGSSVLSGSVTSGVTLSGGDLTIPAGTSDYSTVSVGGGTLKIQLTQAQSILGYDWWLPLYTSGAVKFVLYNGTVVDATTTAATPGITIAHSSDANVWAGTDYATFGEYYSAKWSNGLPNEGDYVIFKSELNDYMETGTDEGTMMALNLTSPRNLGYVLVKGTDKLEIGVYSGATSALLSTDVLENEVETHITTTYFHPKVVIPHKKLSTSSGFILSCELDSAYADNLKKHETGGSALTDANYWQGTVVFCNRSVSSLELPNYGNAQSKVRFNGVAGSVRGDGTFGGTIELVDYGETPALNLSSGSSNYPLVIGSVVSNGMFKTSGSATALNILLKDISGWTGSFDLASKTIAIGQAVPSSYTGNDGRLHVCQAATVAAGATWKADGGLYLGAGGVLTVNGAVEVKNVTTYGADASITIEDGAVLQVSAASASDNVPTLNFKAGTFRVKEGANTFRETTTINFCAGSGKRTVIDANGSVLTLGPNVFSGSGDVYLTSSKAGGKIVIEGISAAYTGTIYCDISCEVSFGDLSKATNCNIDVADVILSRSSGDVGNLTIGLGATLEVTVTKDNQINGCTIDSVTLNNDATMVLKDKAGQVIETFAAEDAVDGKYVLAADPSITVEYLLDYEFNGNMTSIGTDTTGLSIWNGTASYDSTTQNIYMRCKPYINKTFAMPDDEWTVFMRCTLPVANSTAPTMMLMFGKNGGSVFGLVAGTGENSVALANKDGLIGEEVQVSNATTKHHLYTIVKTENRVRLYVDGVLKVDESATVSVSKEFQIGSVKNGNNTSYQACDDANALIDFLKFYDFAAGQELIDAEVVPDDDPDPVVDPDATSLEESEGFVTSESQLAFKDATLAMLTSEALGGKFGGGWAGTADGADVVFNNFDRTSEAAGTMTCQAQVANDGYVKGVLLTFTQSGDGVYVFMTGAKYIQGASLGDSIAGGSDASQGGEWKYAVSALSLKYLGPAPTAVWVAGEFDDDRSAHGGLEISLNGNTTNALGQIVIGNDVTTGATIKLPDDTFTKASILVKYELASEGAPVVNAAPVGVISTDGYPIVPICTTEGGTILKGAYLNKDNAYALVTNSGNYWPFSVEPTISNGEGYVLLSYHSELANPMSHGTAVYVGSSVDTLTGGNASGLQWKTKKIDKIAIGGPTTAGGANPWKGMIIKGVALFTDEWLTPTDLATYRFPGQGAVLPEDSDLYAIEPVAKWVNDFKTTEKNGCTLSVSGTTAAKDDSFGGTLTIGDASAVIDTTAAATSNMTVLIKYRAASNVTNAPIVAFGAPATYGLDVGVYTKLDKTLAVYRNFSTDNGKPYNFSADPVLSATGGYVLCARDNGQQCMAYVGDSLDAMTGGTVSDGNIKFSNLPLKSLGIGGNSSFPANANDMVPFTGFEIEKIVIFSGYYTPDQIRYVAIPEDSDTLSIADGVTWKFAAGTTRTYTNIGTLSTGGTIAVTNASELAEGSYMLATWTTAQKKSTGYGHVGTLDVTGLPVGLSAELVYGARAIYLRVWNPTTQAEKGTIKVWPYGDSITEGFNAGGTRANYRVLLAQKLSMLGYNVEMVGCYDKINQQDGIDPAGQAIPDAWKWHSAKHGATAGPTTSAAGRANLCENVDTLSAQAGNPDVVLLLAGANDIVPATKLTAQQVVSSITNIVAHLAVNLPDAKIVVGTQINVEQGYNSGNYTHVTNMIPQVNALLKAYAGELPEALNGKVFLADLNAYVKSGEYGILFDHGSDHLHPDWWGHDQMAEGWLSIITNQFTSTQTFPSATIPAAPTSAELGAAAKSELADYRQGFKLARRIDAASNLNTSNPYATTGDGSTNNIEKVAYFVEYVRADNNAHKWVWVDMDAFGTTINDVGLPTANHQQVVTKLHVKSNHNGIDDVAADDDSITGFVEFSPYNYDGNASGVSGAPAGNGSCCDWNDTLYESGSYSCMQVHRVFSPAKAAADGITRGGQVLFAYNNWQSSSSTAEFGIGNFSSHFYRGASDAQTLDYTYTANAPKINASAYSVKRIEIWTKAAGDEKTTTTTDFPVPYSWIEACFPGIEGQPDAMYETMAKSPGDNGYTYWESYVLGLEPTNEQSKFTALIRMDGTTPIVEFSPTNDAIAIQYILQGKPTLTNDWQDVEFDEPGDTNRFFRVRVAW